MLSSQVPFGSSAGRTPDELLLRGEQPPKCRLVKEGRAVKQGRRREILLAEGAAEQMGAREVRAAPVNPLYVGLDEGRVAEVRAVEAGVRVALTWRQVCGRLSHCVKRLAAMGILNVVVSRIPHMLMDHAGGVQSRAFAYTSILSILMPREARR